MSIMNVGNNTSLCYLAILLLRFNYLSVLSLYYPPSVSSLSSPGARTPPLPLPPFPFSLSLQAPSDSSHLAPWTSSHGWYENRRLCKERPEKAEQGSGKGKRRWTCQCGVCWDSGGQRISKQACATMQEGAYVQYIHRPMWWKDPHWSLCIDVCIDIVYRVYLYIFIYTEYMLLIRWAVKWSWLQ